MKTNKLLSILGSVTLALMLAAFVFPNKPWVVPDKNDKMKNPVKSDASNISEAKALFVEHCQSCHGKKGKGDGPKAAQLETECGDFTTPAFQKQSDGSIFYKVSEGRDDMPSFKKKIKDENDIWSLVNYVRTLK